LAIQFFSLELAFKAFESYRLTDRQTDTTEIIYHSALGEVKHQDHHKTRTTRLRPKTNITLPRWRPRPIKVGLTSVLS